jgi:23S rRNA (pseudouridine1915-N3)-methyltransferase
MIIVPKKLFMFLGIIIPDKLSSSIYLVAYKEYMERIGFYCDIKLFDFKVKYTKDLKRTMDFQRNKILDITGKYSKIAVDSKGKHFDSLDFSHWMGNMMLNNNAMFFILGGAYGLPKEIIEVSDEKISLGKLTFSHEIALLILLEQIYRGFTILNNHPYHK